MPRVTLSFDNGPDPDITPRVLDVLAERGVTAHFFVLGKWLADPARRRWVVRARDDGHLIGNHSFSHATPLGVDPRPDAVEREIAATEALLAPILPGPGPKRFRPFGSGGVLGPQLLSRAAVDHLIAHGYSCVLWNSVPRDWLEPDAWAARASPTARPARTRCWSCTTFPAPASPASPASSTPRAARASSWSATYPPTACRSSPAA